VQRITIQGKRREIGLGSAELVSLGKVRSKAIENYKLAREGGNPLKDREEAREKREVIPTFEQAAYIVHDMRDETWTDKHSLRFINSLKIHVFPQIGHMKISDITSADILGVLQPIWTKKTETARKIKQRIIRIMKWAIVKNYRKDNPAENVDEALPRVDMITQSRKALPYEEVRQCIERVKQSKAGITTKLALEFLILTAARSGEVRGATWAEIDFDKSLWEIPAERMKMKRAHRVPLGIRGMEILSQAKMFDFGYDLIFPNPNSGKPLSDMTLSKLVKELGFDVDVHGFRTSFRTWAQEQTDYPREIAEMALAHGVGNAVEQAYARSDLLDRRRKMMNDWADYIAQAA